MELKLDRLIRPALAIVLLLVVAEAVGQTHWAFRPPVRAPLPAVKDVDWIRTPVDQFILARLEAEQLRPSRVASKEMLIRRLTLDLTGLPPTPDQIDSFLGNKSPDAFQQLVDRLLASPAYGERMALLWLDLARYADTDGYEVDEERSMWPWRDWVIRAFNLNMPFDRFTIEQLAGDLIVGATLDQEIATGFNRNHRINREAGTIPEEFQVEGVVDRVDTTATVWLGLTVACARCHDHKYDPISQEEFYQFYAFFNNLPEIGNGGGEGGVAEPVIRLASAESEAQIAVLESEISSAGEDEALLEKLKQQKKDLLKPIPVVMVMKEREELRETFVLHRGQYDQPRQLVTPDVPKVLPPLAEGVPADRLSLARWLVDPDHPLTARVMINHLWRKHFGKGLVDTAEDFGVRGERPTHPGLLDWLAAELVRNGWDLKAIQKLIVSSATYRQSSASRDESAKTLDAERAHSLPVDPENLLFSRAPRLRLSAEMIRDQALAVSGLLVKEIGGPSVKPYQPEGLWLPITHQMAYVQDHGWKLYRRSMYTFWKRTIPPPAMTSFDAPTREICTVKRSQSNTPLQALVLLNDTTFVEAARALAQRMVTEAGHTAEERIRYGFRLATARWPSATELSILRKGLDDYLESYQQDKRAAEMLLAIGESPSNGNAGAEELAAYMMVASIILNLDETITRQ